MNRLLWLCGSVTLSLLLPQAAPAVPCASGSLQSYIDLGASGCSVGDALVAGFAIQPGS